MKKKKKTEKPVAKRTYIKLLMQFDAIVKEHNKNSRILSATEHENQMRANQITNLGKCLSEVQIKFEASEKLNSKLQVDLDRERKMVDYLIREKE